MLLLLILTISCVTISLIIVALALMEDTKSLSKWLLNATLISLTGLYIDALPAGVAFPDPYELPFEFISIFNIGLIWWLALSILNDQFRLSLMAWLGMIASVFPTLFLWGSELAGLTIPPVIDSFLTSSLYVTSAVLIMHVLWVAISGYSNDLLGSRRVIRLCIAVLPIMAIGANLAADFILGDLEQRLLRVAFALPLTLIVMFWLIKFESMALNFQKEAVAPQNKIDPKDTAAYKRLLVIMEQEHAYLEPELSIAGLADRVGVPTHQLRNIINRGMGFRNFFAFLSSYRIDGIKQTLADPEHARVPILTIALNGGFSSLATFNRAFKAQEKQTAGAYRKEALGSPTSS